MTGLRRSVLGRADQESPDRTDCYECPHCEATFADWPVDCPTCGLVVVRIVEPRPVPDR